MTERFEGHVGRECGEHRTLGARAWCHDCSEYCYPDGPCRGCEIPQLRAQAARAAQLATALRALLDTAQHVGGPNTPWSPLVVSRAAVDEARALLDGDSAPADPGGDLT